MLLVSWSCEMCNYQIVTWHPDSGRGRRKRKKETRTDGEGSGLSKGVFSYHPLYVNINVKMPDDGRVIPERHSFFAEMHI